MAFSLVQQVEEQLSFWRLGREEVVSRRLLSKLDVLELTVSPPMTTFNKESEIINTDQ